MSQLSKSVHTYVNEYRITKANQLLTDKWQLNMDTVAVRCGFHSSQTGKGKVLTSFPDAFLNKESPVYKAYPFSAEASIKRHGGIFRHGANGKSHVEVDGRLVTGMSWESSVGVAESMIRLIEQ